MPKPLTTKQQQAYDLRKSGLTLADIGRQMGVTREQVRQWVASARYKLGLPPEALRTLTCLRCGESWESRKLRPVQCPRCKSPFWNRERKTKTK